MAGILVWFDRLQSSPTTYLVTAVVYHLLYSLCALDLYFRSPITRLGEMRAHQSSASPPAKRLVFVTLDGAPADVVFSEKGRHVPFLHQKIREGASWGVTHTHVPTESRPGHIALISGMYEDPSAVTTGWQTNPISFDTVWKEAAYAWQWGAPEIVNLFADSDHIFTEAFPPELNDFAQSPQQVDDWVADRVHDFLDRAEGNATLRGMLHSDRVVFFLHFLGMDSAGHRFTPSGKGYLETLHNVDSRLAEVVTRLEGFFGDGKTAYVVTADHGMTARGSHGDGSKEETRVPVVAWGDGVETDCRDGSVMHWQEAFGTEEEERSYVESEWGLNPSCRKDLEPADTAMLLASLLSVPLPLHSEGTVPTSFLRDRFTQTLALATNARQAKEMVDSAASLRKERSRVSFTPWAGEEAARETLRQMTLALESQDIETAGDLARQAIRQYRDGSRYYNEYDRMRMTVAVAWAYLVWMGYGAALVSARKAPLRASSYLVTAVAVAVLVPVAFLQGLSGRDLCYVSAPFVLLPFVLHRLPFFTWDVKGLALSIACVAAVVVGFHHRPAFTVAMWVASAVLPWDTATRISGVVCGVFTLLPCVGTAFLPLVTPSAALLAAASYRCGGGLGSGILAASSFLTFLSDCTPVDAKVVVWAALFAALFLPAAKGFTLEATLVSHLGAMTLLSVGYEPLFLASLASFTYLATRRTSSPLLLGVMTTFGMYFGFFGTGNMASISSFDISSVYRLQTQFSKPLMGALLVLKLWLPLLALTITLLHRFPGSFVSILITAVSLSDCVALYFFATLRNTGSWKEIGQSISRFVIANLLVVVLLLLWGLSRLFLPSRQPARHYT